MNTHVHIKPVTIPLAVRQPAWFVFGSAVAFAIPYVGVSLLDLQHDVYYAAYFAITLGLLAAYARTEQIDVRALFTRNWVWSLADRSASRSVRGLECVSHRRRHAPTPRRVPCV